jgi:glycosyltransferase involved in cell wall biosynthesis
MSRERQNAAFVVEERSNPSTDYFVSPALSAMGLTAVKCRPGELPPDAALAGATVVFVRYVPAAWMALIERARPSPGRVVYFMDDDLLDWRAAAGTPLRYRLKLVRQATSRRRWLEGQGAELWVSTPWLLRKYGDWNPRLVLPTPVVETGEAVQLFYHGTASHGGEIRWLRPVVEAALAQEPRLRFEIVGGADVFRLYRDLPGIRAVHPMQWPAYRSFLTASVRHIGLAPLLESPFNRARSFTRFLDITRAGAAGIYSAGSACADMVEDGVDGVVVPLREEAWVDAIVALARDPERRERLAREAVRKSDMLAANAQAGYGALREKP